MHTVYYTVLSTLYSNILEYIFWYAYAYIIHSSLSYLLSISKPCFSTFQWSLRVKNNSTMNYPTILTYICLGFWSKSNIQLCNTATQLYSNGTLKLYLVHAGLQLEGGDLWLNWLWTIHPMPSENQITSKLSVSPCNLICPLISSSTRVCVPSNAWSTISARRVFKQDLCVPWGNNVLSRFLRVSPSPSYF